MTAYEYTGSVTAPSSTATFGCCVRLWFLTIFCDVWHRFSGEVTLKIVDCRYAD